METDDNPLPQAGKPDSQENDNNPSANLPVVSVRRPSKCQIVHCNCFVRGEKRSRGSVSDVVYCVDSSTTLLHDEWNHSILAELDLQEPSVEEQRYFWYKEQDPGSRSVRLRRRDASAGRTPEEDVDAGFVRGECQPARCQSTQSLAYNGGSQFNTIGMRPHVDFNRMPTAVVGPHRIDVQHAKLSQSFYDDRHKAFEEHRRSLHALNALSAQSLHGSYVDVPVGDVSPMRPAFLTQNGHSANATPHAIRRTMNVNVLTSPYAVTPPHLESPMFSSTPNKVASQPHRRHRERNVDGDGGRHVNMGMAERRGSGSMALPSYHNYSRNVEEIYVDETPKDPRVSALETRVRDLEAKLGAAQASTSLIIPVTPTTQHKTESDGGVQIHRHILMMKDADREFELDELKSKLRKAHKTMELQQAQYNDEVQSFKEDSKLAREELARVKSRLSALESECELYKNKAAAVEAQQKEELSESKEKLKQQEKELAALKAEVQKTKELEEEVDTLHKELEFLELQNETLNTTLDAKEDSIRQLEGDIVSMRLEASLYQQSCSSGSTPLAEEQQSLADVRPPPFRGGGDRTYKKAHSTLGMEQSLPSPTHLTKSFSNYHIDGGAKNGSVSPAVSQLLRSQQKRVLDCRLLSKCLKESAQRAFDGQSPNINSLLALKADSMSESEAETVAFDSSSMSMNSAEKQLRRHEDELMKVERDLSAIRALLQNFYQQRLQQELDDDDGCRLQ